MCYKLRTTTRIGLLQQTVMESLENYVQISSNIVQIIKYACMWWRTTMMSMTVIRNSVGVNALFRQFSMSQFIFCTHAVCIVTLRLRNKHCKIMNYKHNPRTATALLKKFYIHIIVMSYDGKILQASLRSLPTLQEIKPETENMKMIQVTMSATLFTSRNKAMVHRELRPRHLLHKGLV